MIKCESTKYPDGIGYCLYRVIGDDNDCGLCFDIEEKEIDESIKALQEAKNRDPDNIYEPDLEWEEYQKKQAILETKWYYKAKEFLKDISIQIHPFDWRFNYYMVSRPIESSYGEKVYKVCDGICLGCLTLTWGRLR